jgi:hypothetical protein
MAGDLKPIPLLEIWEKYPEETKKLIKTPLAAGLAALKQAYANDDWREVEQAIKLLEFISEGK